MVPDSSALTSRRRICATAGRSWCWTTSPAATRRTCPRAPAWCGPTSARPRPARRVATGRFDVVNHHAAQIDVRVSVDRPAFDSHINVVGFVNLLEGAGEGGVKRVIFASSGGVVYGDPRDHSHAGDRAQAAGLALRGEQARGRVLPAGAGAPCAGSRASPCATPTCSGPGRTPSPKPAWCRSSCPGCWPSSRSPIFGDGRQTRDYVFVKDVARANVLASTVPAPSNGDFDAPGLQHRHVGQRSVLDLAGSVGRRHGREAQAGVCSGLAPASSSAAPST